MPSLLTHLKHSALALLIFTLIGLAPLHARQGVGALSGTAEKLSVATTLAQSAVLPGSSTKAALVVTLEDGWHVNAHIPSEDYLIGTSFNLEAREGFILADIRYPLAKPVTFEFSDKPLDVYEGTFPRK